MPNSTTTRNLAPARSAGSLILLAGIVLTLAACGGASGMDGTYYTQDANGTSDPGQLVIEGNTLTHHEYECEGVYEEPDVTSTGEFNDDQTMVTWLVAGDDMRNERVGTEPVTASENSISISGEVYVHEDSDAGKALLEAFEADCADEG